MYAGERMNSITHLTGAVAAAVGTTVLVVLASRQGDPWKIVSFSVYGATLILLYLASTLYHSVHGRSKQLFQKLDHGAIYLLIAGTYTPFTLVTLRGPFGWTVFGIVWGLAAVGIAYDAGFGGRKRVIPVIIYLTMGWLVVIVVRPLLLVLPVPGFLWLLAGGLLYTGGILFYALDKRLAFGHGIWHLFVLGGSAAHFVAVFQYVL